MDTTAPAFARMLAYTAMASEAGWNVIARDLPTRPDERRIMDGVRGDQWFRMTVGHGEREVSFRMRRMSDGAETVRVEPRDVPRAMSMGLDDPERQYGPASTELRLRDVPWALR